MTAAYDDPLDQTDAIRAQCWNNALEACGTAYIFERRARRLNRWLQVLTYIGILGPLLVGAVALAFGTSFSAFAVILAAAAFVTIAQLLVATWSVVSKWVDAQAYAVESASINHSLELRFKSLAENPGPIDQLSRTFERLQCDDQHRRDLDYRWNLSEREKRMGLRAALRQFRRECVQCRETPTSMQPSDCDVCGNFSIRQMIVRRKHITGGSTHADRQPTK